LRGGGENRDLQGKYARERDGTWTAARLEATDTAAVLSEGYSGKLEPIS
jgi:hypothetical protein